MNTMMNKYLFLFSITWLIVGVLSDLKTVLDQEPCLVDDNECFTNYTKVIYKTLVEGVEELGIKSIEPSYLERINGSLAILKYTLYNSTVRGLKDCQIERASILPDQENLKFDILCPKFHISGVYEGNGTLIVIPVNGNGEYWVEAKIFKLEVNAKIEQYKGEDGQKYVLFKGFKYVPKLEGGADFDVTNLFGGNRALSDRVLRFARNHWRMVARQLQDPPIEAFLNLLFDSFNSLLKHVPLDNIIKE